MARTGRPRLTRSPLTCTSLSLEEAMISRIEALCELEEEATSFRPSRSTMARTLLGMGLDVAEKARAEEEERAREERRKKRAERGQRRLTFPKRGRK